jgi:uncharacterized protein (DUF885 family)
VTRHLILIFVLSLASCVLFQRAQTYPKLAEEYVYARLAISPVAATMAGYHLHRSVSLDEMIDDLSEAGRADQRKYLEDFKQRWSKVNREELSAEDRADYDLINASLELTLFDRDVLKSAEHEPQMYAELVGNALFAPYTLKYTTDAVRYSHIIKRIEKIPALMEQAKQNLKDAPADWTRVAAEENEGNIALIDKTIRATVPAPLRSAFDRAAGPALEALRGYNAWLASDLSKRTSDWRLGPERYARKFKLSLGVDRTPDEVLAEAENLLAEYRAEMEQLAGKEGVKAALDRIAKKHATPEMFFDDAKRDLAEATAFVREKKLVRLPEVSKLEVIATPEFMRGSYGVGGFNPAPALEPKLGSFYWVTPLPADPARAESKLREYNFYGLKLLTVHEAMPGHYLQYEYAGAVEPAARRLTRATLSSGPYVEGWAVYATQTMLEQGYYGDDRDMRLSWLKHLLRVISNTILDIRLHTKNMSQEEALRLMIDQTYQEREEAVLKWQRAQLSSVQLPEYFVGWREWVRLRDSEKGRLGSAFDLAAFHEKALRQGGVRLGSLRELIK